MSPAAFVQRPIRWLRAVSRYRAYISGGPTFAYDLCSRRISEEDRAGLDLSAWEIAYVGAEPVSAAVLERFVQTYAPYGFRAEALHPCYGLAEATLLVSGSRDRPQPTIVSVRRADLEQHRANPTAADEPNSIRLVGCGAPMPDEKVLLVDPETNRVCEPGQVGEVWVAGESVAGGYWRQPEATEETFGGDLPVRARLNLRTGDLAFRTRELFITGRIRTSYRPRLTSTRRTSGRGGRGHPALPPGRRCFACLPATSASLLFTNATAVFRDRPGGV
jgi:acyl-CoA synthetase (AMP-forming)/AMP-acid ligase II